MISLFFHERQIATNLIAACARLAWLKSLFNSKHMACCAGLVVLLLGGCALPDRPSRATLYDFGPDVPTVMSLAAPVALALPPLAIGDITSSGALDSPALLYRLAYADVQQPRPYTQARWSAPPAQLVQQRVREQLGQRRTVVSAREGVALGRNVASAPPLLLRLELAEFGHLFTAPDTSVGLVRLRATLLELTPAGEKLIGQRSFTVQRPAPSPDAPGGVRALTLATDAAIDALEHWLQQMPVRP